MHPELFTVPGLGITVKTYGFCLMVGFLSAVWLAMRRAQRVKADPDLVLDLGFIALLFGVGGARLFYVIHYWHTDFAMAPNRFLAIIDIRQGGLEFLGGFLGAVGAITVWLLVVKKQSLRLYLDILTPSVPWGLAFGRLGCFFNGCCFGGLCLVPGATRGEQAKFPWAVEFPYGSPAHMRQWENRQVTIPAELLVTHTLTTYPLPPAALNLSPEKRLGPKHEVSQLEDALAAAKKTDPDGPRTRKLAEALANAKAKLKAVKKKYFLDDLARAQQFPSRKNPERPTSVSELEAMAKRTHSLPVHPTQLYSVVNALLLAGLLTTVFYRRKRHGVVIGLFFLLYPISRVLLEMIRADNPPDVAGLTVSQFVGLMMFVGSAIYLFVLYRYLPERSPAADRAGPPEADDQTG